MILIDYTSRNLTEAVFVITLRQRRSKWKLMEDRLKQAGLPFNPFWAVDSESPSELRGVANPKSLHRGTLACALSHWKVANEVLSRGLSHALVLEDDVAVEVDAAYMRSALQELPRGVDLAAVQRPFWSGAEGLGEPIPGGKWRPCSQVPHGTYGYVLTRSGAEKWLRQAMPISDHADCFLRSRSDWRMMVSTTPWVTHLGNTPDHRSEVGGIPKVVHQIWCGDQSKLPGYVRSWSHLNELSGFRHVIWREEDLISEFPELWQNISSTAPNLAAVSDAFRYAILERRGGIYADTDYESLQPLQGLLGAMAGAKCDFAFGWEPAGFNLPEMPGTAFLVSRPAHPLSTACLKDVRAKLQEGYEPSLQGDVIGPGMLLRQLTYAAFDRDAALQVSDSCGALGRSSKGLLAIDAARSYPYGFNRGHGYSPMGNHAARAYGCHHWAASWVQRG